MSGYISEPHLADLTDNTSHYFNKEDVSQALSSTRTPQNDDGGFSPRGRKRSRSSSRTTDGYSSTYGSRANSPRPAKRLKQDAADLSNYEIEELSVVTKIPSKNVGPEDEESRLGIMTMFKNFGDSIADLMAYEKAPTMKLNPLGDVTMIIRKPDVRSDDEDKKAPEAEYVLCAMQSLREAANGPLWKTLLMKGRKIDVPDADDYFGLLFLLRVAHGCDLGKYYPKALSFEQVVQVTSMVHKYDASPKVRQEVVARIPSRYKYDSIKVTQHRNCSQWLLVAWTLGLKAVFADLLWHLVRTTQMNEEGELLDQEGHPLMGSFPATALGNIKEARKKYLDSLLDVAYNFAADLRRSDLPICFAPDKHKSHNCAALMCGSFGRGLAKIGLPEAKPNVEEVKLSVDALEKHLKGIEGHQPQCDLEWDASATNVPDVHPNCQNKALWHFIVDRELKGIGGIALHFAQYLEIQRAKRKV